MNESTSLTEWIAHRTPPAPGGFAAWMQPRDPEVPASAETLTTEAHAALRDALDGRSRPRLGAFDLLAADGFATWACEAALEGRNADADLRRILQTLLR
jgi:hypothetical protein